MLATGGSSKELKGNLENGFFSNNPYGEKYATLKFPSSICFASV